MPVKLTKISPFSSSLKHKLPHTNMSISKNGKQHPLPRTIKRKHTLWVVHHKLKVTDGLSAFMFSASLTSDL